MNTNASIMRRLLFVPLVAAVLFAGLSGLTPAEASAQTRSFEEGPVVRRMLLFRSNKLELAPSLGVAFGNVYQRELFLSVLGRYHLTNSFALGLNVSLGPVALNTPIAGNLEEIEPENADRGRGR